MKSLYEDLNIAKMKELPDIVCVDLFTQWARGLVSQVAPTEIANTILVMVIRLELGMLKLVPMDSPQGLSLLKTEYVEKVMTDEEAMAAFNKVDLRIKQLIALGVKNALSFGTETTSSN